MKTKLFIFMSLPFSLILFLGVNQISNNFQTYVKSTQSRQFITVSVVLEKLMFELQKERGLTELYIALPTKDFSKKVDKQRINTNKYIIKFKQLKNSTIDLLSSSILKSNIPVIELKFNEASSLVNELENVRKKTDKLDRQQAFDYYSNLIAKILGIIENIGAAQTDPNQGRRNNNFINLLWLIERSGQERGALNGILASKDLNTKKLQTVLDFIAAQEKIIERLLLTAPIAQQKVLSNILASSEHQEILLIREKLRRKLSRDIVISQMTSLMGFNGIIHHLKDHIITGNRHFLDKADDELIEFDQMISQFEHRYLISKSDISAIGAIKELSHIFKLAIEKSRLTSLEIPRQTTSQSFNEETVKYAIDSLQKGQLDISDKKWWQLTSKRLDAIYSINTDIEQKLIRFAKELERSSIYILIISIVTILVFSGISFLLCYLILQRFVGEIGNIVTFMKKAQNTHDFNKKITITGDDEISEIERAYNELLVERQKYEHSMRISAAVFEYASEAICITNADNIIEETNPAFTKITGYSAQDVIGFHPLLFKSDRHDKTFYQEMWQNILEHDNWQGEIWTCRKNGQVYPQYLAISVVRDSNHAIIQHIALFSDISKYKQYESDIWHQANYDALTNLPNRNLLSDRLEHELELMQRHGKRLAILFVDLDRFKHVNDTYGHSIGDELIISVAERFSQCIRKSDTVARLGGDEFIMLMPNINQIHDIEKIAAKIIKAASVPIELSNGYQAIVTASVGISVYPEDADNAESLLKNADAAMYQAKDSGKNTFCFYTAKINEDVSRRMQLEMELRQAITNQDFVLHYQPIFCVKTNKIVGAEALLRWQHPTRGLIYPDDFIEVAEDTGLIVDIGIQVLEQAALTINQLHQQNHKIHISVNISGRQCISTSIPIEKQISRVLKKYKISPNLLHIEITESMLMENTQFTKDTFEAIKLLGVKIYMDDFGTGYSSLSYLKQFPIDVIKIDRSFIFNMLEDNADADLVKAIVMIGHNLKLKLVAEGVETQEHLEYLIDLGCDFIQGYHISRPLPLEKLMSYLSHEKSCRKLSSELDA